ncbi:MAG: diguanylate cyclase [Deltaproteobacteria bacterium]|nr:diguanylate cyclase [Deltaproteobacteria bacterium]MDH3851368.1 diguanylate cyclase [Deltaproteobacteria bacterium]MDH3928847.1 diguanylate cyclase [Deltaproteobacteria bacterium]
MNQPKQYQLSMLSVDDDGELRELLHELICQMGHASVTAADGVDALEKMEEKQFDIVITDINMPRLNGVGLIKRITSDFSDTDVIAITGYQTEYNYTDIIALGASDFISKPINIDEFEAKIKRIVRERNMRFELRRLSTCDALTGLYNRRHLDDNLQNEAIRASRQHYDLYLLLIDIDNFKVYNDKYGHQQGDRLLQELARIILRSIRDNVDSGYRYGGDEFAATILHANPQQALMVAERLRTEYNERNLVPTSLSIGIAKLKNSHGTLEEDLDDLIRKADQALYLAKNNGGDQNVILDISSS